MSSSLEDTSANRTCTHNAANEIATVGGSSTNVAHDLDGNLSRIPLGQGMMATHEHATWDAWNRLVEVRSANDSTVLMQCRYDGLNRRIVKKKYVSGSLNETRRFLL